MKKIYLFALSAMFGVSAMAQVSVTFQVDMNGQMVDPTGVHVAGSWQEEAGFPADWEPGTSEMTDNDSDGIYTLTVDIPAGQYGFKYLRGNDWPLNEEIPTIARIGNDRGFAVTQWHADNGGLILPAVVFSGAAPEGMIPVRLVTNVSQLSEISPEGIHVAGNLITPIWEPQYGTAMMVNPDEYAYITYVDQAGTYEYKFLNGILFGADDEWSNLEPEDIPECANDNVNRTIEVVEGGVSTPAYCYEACETCADPNVTLTVDMSSVETVADEIFAAGSFNGYSNEAMTDNGDGTYSIILALAPGTYQFKFKNGSDGWEDVPGACTGEGTGDREFTVVEDEFFSLTRCFAQCGETCATNPEPSDITFRVNMEAENEVSPDGVWVMGGFTTPQWQNGAIQMTDADADGVYEVTVEDVSGSADIAYKFANGLPSEVEEDGDFVAGGCGVSNGLGGFNRTLVRTGEPMILDVVCYNYCLDCGFNSLEENELGNISIFPNPSTGASYIDIQNPNGYTLRMNIVDITGKTVRENISLNSTTNEFNTQSLNAGIYFLNIVNQHNDRAVYKLMVK